MQFLHVFLSLSTAATRQCNVHTFTFIHLSYLYRTIQCSHSLIKNIYGDIISSFPSFVFLLFGLCAALTFLAVVAPFQIANGDTRARENVCKFSVQCPKKTFYFERYSLCSFSFRSFVIAYVYKYKSPLSLARPFVAISWLQREVVCLCLL